MFPQPKRAEARLTFRDRVRDRPAYESLSDLVLAVRAKDGDERALETLVERHAPGVRRLTAYLLADTQDAEDAAQEALAKLCTRIGQFRGEARFQTWLHSLVANTCRDPAVRQRRRRHQPLDVVPESAAAELPAATSSSRTTGTWPATSPATRSCRACSRSRRWPSSGPSAVSPTPSSPASSRSSRVSTTSASSASCGPATCSTSSAGSPGCAARSERPTRAPTSVASWPAGRR